MYCCDSFANQQFIEFFLQLYRFYLKQFPFLFVKQASLFCFSVKLFYFNNCYLVDTPLKIKKNIASF